MDGLRAAALLAVAAMLLLMPVRRFEPGRRTARRFRPVRWFRGRHRDPLHGDAPALLVRELAGLLAAGRSGHRIWADAAELYDARAVPGAPVHPFTPVLQAAAAAAALGFSPLPVLSAAGRSGPPLPGPRLPGPAAVPGSRASAAEEALRDLWAGLAVCVRVSERSGAPLAAVLTRYAGQLEAARDAASDRDAALGGPRATVRLLTWLPAGGMLLGYLLGGNPLYVLTATPLGWAAAALGGGFWLAGRLWSAKLVRTAEGTIPPGPG